jgi:hypothetical protein
MSVSVESYDGRPVNVEFPQKYAELIVPFKMSWFPPYDFAGKFYWKDKVYLKSGAGQ